MKKRLVWIVLLLVAVLGVGAFVFRGKDKQGAIEYHYAKVERGEVSQSIEASGQLVALTSVDVKSKAGGKVVHLFVDEGTIVHKGDPIATIDPADTQAGYDQAQADLSSSQAKAIQARDQYELQLAQSKTAVADARETLRTAIIRLQRTQIESGRQPILSDTSVASAQAAYDEAYQALLKLQKVTIPQTERDAKGAVLQSKMAYDTAKAQRKRSEDLLKKGYIAQSQLEKDQTAESDADQAYQTVVQRRSTLEDEVKLTLSAQEATVSRLRSSLEQAKAGLSDKDVAKTNLAEAKAAVDQARVALQKAIDDERNNEIRKQDILAAHAATVRDKVTVNNAKVQLDSTNVVAPRDGVVTLKYLEEGTIIPPGESTFAQGTSLVQVSDITKMYVDCTVDEADISQVKPGQRVRIKAEAYKDSPADGKVVRISPSAVTTNNVTTVKVRVLILPDPKRKIALLPGMNASCEFITDSKENVLWVPSQAVQSDDDGKTFVQVKSADPKKPTKKYVTVGIVGNDNVEITDGLAEGDEVVTAAIDVDSMEKLQEKMLQAQEGGLAGGGRRGIRSLSTKSKSK